MTKNKDLPEQQYQIVLFEDKNIRRTWHEDEWYYSVADVVGVLADSKDSNAYWRQLKKRESQLVTNCHGLKLLAPHGKMRETDCANTQGLLRIIQSVPSKKAEPIKLWLAEVGRERLEEMQNPELAMQRMQEEYKSRGYDGKVD